MNMKFGVEESKRLKGIAILMMLIHHLFGFPEWLANGNTVLTWNESFLMDLATFCKLCVGIYAFCTGYSLFIQKDQSWKKRLYKLFQFLKQYWIIFLLFLLIGFIFQEPLPSWKQFLLQCFGLNTATGYNWKYFNTIHPVFAWYVSFYILFVLTSPILVKFCQKNWFVDFILIYFLSVLGLNWSKSIEIQMFYKLFYLYFTWMPVGMSGYIVSKYNLLNKINFKNMNLILSFLLIVTCFFLRTNLNNYRTWYSIKFPLDVFFTLILIIGLLGILNIWKSKSLLFLSVHSTNIWFLHGLFFTPKHGFQDLLYGLKYPVLIFSVALLVCLGMSMGIDWICRKIRYY